MVEKRGVIAVDLGGTNLRVALVMNGRIVKYIKNKTPKSRSEILKLLFDSIEGLMSRNVRGIGIGSPGPLENGIIRDTPNLPFKNFNLKNAVRRRFKIRVEVENDANCVALAEARVGVRKKNFFILTLGTGIGGGVIIDGSLYDEKGLGSELGSIYISRDKSFEDLVGMKGIRSRTKRVLGREVNLSDLVKMKDSKSRKLLNEIADDFARGIGSLINVFNPEVVVLAGGMRYAGNSLLRLIKKRVGKYVLLPGKFKIVWSKLNKPGILGAALLVS